MKRTVKVLWGDRNMIVVPIRPEQVTQKARDLVESALANKIKFNYGDVRRMKPALHAYYESELRDLEWQRMHHVNEDTAWQWTSKMAEVRRKRNATVYRNDFEYNRRKRQNESLDKALQLLMDEGEIKSYTLRPNGYLMVEWFTGHDTTEIEVIEQGWTFFREPKLDVGTLSNSVPTPDMTCKAHTVVPEPAPDNTGQGEITTDKIAQRNEDREYFRVQTHALYVQGEEWREKEKWRKQRAAGEKITLWKE